MKAIAVLIALTACADAVWLPPGALQALLTFGLGAIGALLALCGGLVSWWDGSMQPSRRSATVMVCGLLALGTCLFAWLRAAAHDEFR